MRKLASMVAVVAFAALLAACHGSRATVCAPPCAPCPPPPCPPPPCPPSERTRTCATWPEYAYQDPSSPSAYPGRWYLQRIIDDNRWPDVVLAATRCRDNLAPSHAHTTANCYRLWLHVKAAYEANNRGDHDACIGELNHPDHAN